MWRYLFAMILISGLAVEVPGMLERYENHSARSVTTKSTATKPAAIKHRAAKSVPVVVSGHNPYSNRTTEIKLGPRGQFIASARLNGYRSNVLVDTGASAVAINETTARRMGIHLRQSDFKIRVQTANGPTKAAEAMIREIEIGRVIVRDVRTLVSRDESLNTILLGMTFLNRLKKYEVNQGTLILTE